MIVIKCLLCESCGTTIMPDKGVIVDHGISMIGEEAAPSKEIVPCDGPHAYHISCLASLIMPHTMANTNLTRKPGTFYSNE